MKKDIKAWKTWNGKVCKGGKNVISREKRYGQIGLLLLRIDLFVTQSFQTTD